ncbi:unnamed protein product [Cuscuta epithymum]|uniref:Mediator complex subunit 15 KIX domain-containing protein n=1 Tax=Cuscuta epithymum TaxID=186058 RepID=A0AAV0D5U1_9ASTE|nr:unnamed protein product [Cuscuta epithymum]
METLKRHLLFSGQEGLQELKKIDVRFEEKIYVAATNQSNYLRKISLKMLSMETKSAQNPMANPLQANIANSSQNAQEATFEVLPRLNEKKCSSGVVNELLFLDMPRECRFLSGITMIEYDKAVQESVYDQLRVVWEGQLCIIFTPDLKLSVCDGGNTKAQRGRNNFKLKEMGKEKT